MKALRWIAERLKDVFYSTGNEHLDLGRLIVWSASTLMAFAAIWNALKMHQAIDLAALGGGLAAVMTAGAAILAAKQWATGQAMALKRKDESND